MDRRVVRKAVQRVLLTLVLERCSSKVESLSEEYAALIKEWAVLVENSSFPFLEDLKSLCGEGGSKILIEFNRAKEDNPEVNFFDASFQGDLAEWAALVGEDFADEAEQMGEAFPEADLACMDEKAFELFDRCVRIKDKNYSRSLAYIIDFWMPWASDYFALRKAPIRLKESTSARQGQQ